MSKTRTLFTEALNPYAKIANSINKKLNYIESSIIINADSFEEKMFHIIRAFHVAGRCTDCGECSRVCPQGIPLHLFNRKFIKDIDELYGEFHIPCRI